MSIIQLSKQCHENNVLNCEKKTTFLVKKCLDLQIMTPKSNLIHVKSIVDMKITGWKVRQLNLYQISCGS